jgi:hypothetical protein
VVLLGILSFRLSSESVKPALELARSSSRFIARSTAGNLKRWLSPVFSTTTLVVPRVDATGPLTTGLVATGLLTAVCIVSPAPE